jgi:hypothetical protein
VSVSGYKREWVKNRAAAALVYRSIFEYKKRDQQNETRTDSEQQNLILSNKEDFTIIIL